MILRNFSRREPSCMPASSRVGLIAIEVLMKKPGQTDYQIIDIKDAAL